MLEQLALMSDPLPLYAYLNDLLVPHLGRAIADNHFQIHDRTIRAPAHLLHINEDYVLRRSGEGFVAEIDGAAHMVLATALPDGTPVEGVLPTITREGEFAFAFARLAVVDEGGALEIVARLENVATGERASRAISLPPAARAGAGAEGPRLALRRHDGIPVWGNLRLDGPSSGASEFFQAASRMHESPVAILDKRGIGGGFTTSALSWLSGYTGQFPSQQRTFVSFSMVHVGMMGRFTAAQASEARFPPPGWALPMPFAESAPLSNENLLIVLMDKGAGSAGDFFAGYLRQIENALFVGTNTNGTLVTGPIMWTSLPRSGFAIIFGTSLNLRPDLSQFEGVGFLPDLWVPPGESLERALRFIERYGLNR